MSVREEFIGFVHHCWQEVPLLAVKSLTKDVLAARKAIKGLGVADCAPCLFS